MKTLDIKTSNGLREFIIINGVVVMIRSDGTFKAYRRGDLWRLYYHQQIAYDDTRRIVELLEIDDNRNIKQLAHRREPYILDIILKYAPKEFRDINRVK